MQYAWYAPSEVYYTHSAATGIIAGLLEVSEESRDFDCEPAGLYQGCLQGNGVLGVTEFGAQVKIGFSHCMIALRHCKSTSQSLN